MLTLRNKDSRRHDEYQRVPMTVTSFLHALYSQLIGGTVVSCDTSHGPNGLQSLYRALGKRVQQSSYDTT
jgi:hypothetical protein